MLESGLFFPTDPKLSTDKFRVFIGIGRYSELASQLSSQFAIQHPIQSPEFHAPFGKEKERFKAGQQIDFPSADTALSLQLHTQTKSALTENSQNFSLSQPIARPISHP